MSGIIKIKENIYIKFANIFIYAILQVNLKKIIGLIQKNNIHKYLFL